MSLQYSTVTNSDDDFDDSQQTNPDLRLRPRALVVEDDATLRALIGTRMRREGFEVIEAGCGDDALDLLAEMAARVDDAVDLLVCDVRIPGTSGLEVARMLRASQWEIPIVLITAFPDRALRYEAARLGVSLLAKPFALDCLSDTVIATMLRKVRETVRPRA